MNKITKIVGGALAVSLLAATAHADVTLSSGRIGGSDVPALAKFYEAAFGLKEVNRLQLGPNVEIMMNFGDSAEAAKASKAPQIIIMHRADALTDPVPHLLFNVTDIATVAAAVKAAGGTMDGDPKPFGNSGLVIGFAKDPAGNRIELLQRAQR